MSVAGKSAGMEQLTFNHSKSASKNGHKGDLAAVYGLEAILEPDGCLVLHHSMVSLGSQSARLSRSCKLTDLPSFFNLKIGKRIDTQQQCYLVDEGFGFTSIGGLGTQL